MEQSASNATTEQAFAVKEDLRVFYKQSLPEILKGIFLQPANGIYTIFISVNPKAFINGLILITAAFFLYTFIPYLLVGTAGREYIGFTPFLQLGFSIVVFLVFISLVSFGLKAIKGKANFKNELFTGGLCSIPLLGFLAVAILAKLFSGGNNMFAGIYGLFNLFNLSSGAGLFFMLPALICFLLLVNVLFQSLKVGGLKDTVAWYLSPVSLLVSFFLTFKIMGLFF